MIEYYQNIIGILFEDYKNIIADLTSVHNSYHYCQECIKLLNHRCFSVEQQHFPPKKFLVYLFYYIKKFVHSFHCFLYLCLIDISSYHQLMSYDVYTNTAPAWSRIAFGWSPALESPLSKSSQSSDCFCSQQHLAHYCNWRGLLRGAGWQMADGEEKQIPIVAAKEILIEIETNMKIFRCPIVWVCTVGQV